MIVIAAGYSRKEVLRSQRVVKVTNTLEDQFIKKLSNILPYLNRVLKYADR